MNAKFSKKEPDEHDYKDMFQQPRQKLRRSASGNRSQKTYNQNDYNYIFPDSDYRNNTENTKAQFTYVKQLIQDKRYDIARRELLKIDHEKADDWLDKLNKIDKKYYQQSLSFFEVKLNLLDFVFFLLLIMGIVYIQSLTGLEMIQTNALVFVTGVGFIVFTWLRNRMY